MSINQTVRKLVLTVCLLMSAVCACMLCLSVGYSAPQPLPKRERHKLVDDITGVWHWKYKDKTMWIIHLYPAGDYQASSCVDTYSTARYVGHWRVVKSIDDQGNNNGGSNGNISENVLEIVEWLSDRGPHQDDVVYRFVFRQSHYRTDVWHLVRP